jgi:transcriptional regulator with XRE-family HTH domain
MARRPRGETPQYVDIHVGRRIRLRRKAARLSMEALAADLVISYQQLQKYETGANRISVALVYQIAGVLQCSVEEFFDGLPQPVATAAAARRNGGRLERFLASPGGMDLMEAFVQLPEHLQRPLVALARASVIVEPPQGGAPTKVSAGD